MFLFNIIIFYHLKIIFNAPEKFIFRLEFSIIFNDFSSCFFKYESKALSALAPFSSDLESNSSRAYSYSFSLSI